MKRTVSILLFVGILAGILTGCGLQVPRPEIKTGEFDFSVTYEWNGETKTVSGVYVCEYNGTDWALDGGYHRDWKGYVKHDKMETQIEIGTTEDGGVILLSFGFYPEYFMDDPATGGREVPEPWLTVSHSFADGDGVEILNDAEIIEETYGVKIISYQYSDPIENTFGLFK